MPPRAGCDAQPRPARLLRGTLIPAIAIPVSIVATFAVMYALGHTLTNFTLLALIV